MIGEIASIINNNPQILDSNFLKHKLKVGEVTASSIPESARISYEGLKATRRRALGATALAAANIGLLYGDDIAFYNIYSQFKNTLGQAGTVGRGLAVAGIVGISGAAQSYLSGKNKEFRNQQYADPLSVTLEDTTQHTLKFTDRMRLKLNRIRNHMGRIATSLVVGPSINAINEDFSKKETYVHSAIYGIASVGLYEAANLSLGALDGPWAPAILAGSIVTSRYVDNACERAATRAEGEQVNDHSDNVVQIPLLMR